MTTKRELEVSILRQRLHRQTLVRQTIVTWPTLKTTAINSTGGHHLKKSRVTRKVRAAATTSYLRRRSNQQQAAFQATPASHGKAEAKGGDGPFI